MEGASAAGAERDLAPRVTWRAWRDQHLYAALSSLGRLLQRPGASGLTVAMMAMALLLPLLLGLAMVNLDQLDGALGEQRELAVFLQPQEKGTAVAAQAEALRALANVAAVRVRTPAEGLDELKRLAGFGQALALLDDNPLPTVLIVEPARAADRAAIEQLAARIGQRGGVDFVHFDLAWRERLTRFAALARRLARVAGVLFGLGALLVVGNAIRMDVASRADEIQVMQVVGAEPSFIRRPFLYAGLWYGLASAVIALAAAAAAYLVLATPVAELAQSYGAEFHLRGPGPAGVGATMLAGIVLGWLGARTATALQLARGRARS